MSSRNSPVNQKFNRFVARMDIIWIIFWPLSIYLIYIGDVFLALGTFLANLMGIATGLVWSSRTVGKIVSFSDYLVASKLKHKLRIMLVLLTVFFGYSAIKWHSQFLWSIIGLLITIIVFIYQEYLIRQET